MAKKVWKPGTFVYPIPAALITSGDMENSNILTVAWTGILNTNPAIVYISVRPERYSYNLIKENKEFYMLCPKTVDVDDIKRLERIKPDLHNPRILSMLIWSTFFQKPMTALCNKVLGVNQVTGIYKITNQLNDMCYIGQAVDVATRWKAHAKCGLDIDTPAGNKLYKAMKEDGIWNFSWELIEQCDKSLLDEKEKF